MDGLTTKKFDYADFSVTLGLIDPQCFIDDNKLFIATPRRINWRNEDLWYEWSNVRWIIGTMDWDKWHIGVFDSEIYKEYTEPTDGKRALFSFLDLQIR
jgi:hypothetical protein